MSILLKPATVERVYGEIAQTIPTKFAFCSVSETKEGTVYSELFCPVQCRDFLGDALIFYKTGKFSESEVFGFYPKDAKDWDGKTLSIQYVKSFDLKKAQKVFHEFEEEVGFRKSKFIFADDAVILKASSKWLKSPLTVSLLTLILRAFEYSEDLSYSNLHELLSEILTQKESVDENYWLTILENIDIVFLLRNIDYILGRQPLIGVSAPSKKQYQNYSNSPGFLHDYSGIVTFAQKVHLFRNNDMWMPYIKQKRSVRVSPEVIKTGANYWPKRYVQLESRINV